MKNPFSRFRKKIAWDKNHIHRDNKIYWLVLLSQRADVLSEGIDKLHHIVLQSLTCGEKASCVREKHSLSSLRLFQFKGGTLMHELNRLSYLLCLKLTPFQINTCITKTRMSPEYSCELKVYKKNARMRATSVVNDRNEPLKKSV